MVTISVFLVGGMGLHLLLTNGSRTNRQLAQTTGMDQLRLLGASLEKDLGSRFPDAQTANLEIDSVSQGTWLRTTILRQIEGPEVGVAELTYELEPGETPGFGRRVVRVVDPDLAPGRGPQAEVRPLFQLGRSEDLIVSATALDGLEGFTATALTLTLRHQQFASWPAMREFLILGGEQ